MDTKLQEYQQHSCLEHPDRSVIAEYSVELRRRIQFHITSILTTKTRHIKHIVRETIEIELHCNNMGTGFCPNKCDWSLLSVPQETLRN
jgi:hypothetical protein